ncbi:MAG: hypothetical protein JXA54_11800 [Candidatus Heimdallarchaeota archaeon]|nr:hypothetical protein [Candidatus Heimdallarchaeota archaeon]
MAILSQYRNKENGLLKANKVLSIFCIVLVVALTVNQFLPEQVNGVSTNSPPETTKVKQESELKGE